MTAFVTDNVNGNRKICKTDALNVHPTSWWIYRWWAMRTQFARVHRTNLRTETSSSRCRAHYDCTHESDGNEMKQTICIRLRLRIITMIIVVYDPFAMNFYSISIWWAFFFCSSSLKLASQLHSLNDFINGNGNFLIAKRVHSVVAHSIHHCRHSTMTLYRAGGRHMNQ